MLEELGETAREPSATRERKEIDRRGIVAG